MNSSSYNVSTKNDREEGKQHKSRTLASDLVMSADDCIAAFLFSLSFLVMWIMIMQLFARQTEKSSRRLHAYY